MRRLSSSLVAALILGVTMLVATAPIAGAAARTRHDGTVTSVDPKAQTLVIREYGAGGRAQDLRVQLAPNAPVVLSERNPRATDVKDEFTNTPISLSAIKPGDFVVVDATGHGTHVRGQNVMVTLRSGK